VSPSDNSDTPQEPPPDLHVQNDGNNVGRIRSGGSGAAAITPTCGEAVRPSLASRPKIIGAAIVLRRNSHEGDVAARADCVDGDNVDVRILEFIRCDSRATEKVDLSHCYSI
jgi:hypothetical protein